MKRILIIEDDETIAAIERDYLTVNDFETDIAASGLTVSAWDGWAGTT